MRSLAVQLIVVLVILTSGVVSYGEVTVVQERNSNETAMSGFTFRNVPAPSKSDAASGVAVTILDGRRDTNGGEASNLTDGRMPTGEDEPQQNFFFAPNTDGGRLLLDMGKVIPIKQVNTYSWHPSTRGPQVYTLYASDGKSEGFEGKPVRDTDPAKCGWKPIAEVDTRAKEGSDGGQYGVSISDTEGLIGTYRYLLLDIRPTEQEDPFGNTFYSEIDVVDPTGQVVAAARESQQQQQETVACEGGKYTITIDTTDAPDLTRWVHEELAPVVQEWYPKIVAMLPSEGYEAPRQVSIRFSESMQGVAATGGTRVSCAAQWFRGELKGEAKGAVVHELVHVAQQFGRSRRVEGATRTPGWLVEGMADYIRWFLYEPETHGADLTRRNISRARYDASYRVSGNFIDWVATECDKDMLRKLNAAARDGKYSEDMWKANTGRTLEELNEQWIKAREAEIAAEEEANANSNALSEQEKAAGWQLLFDGQSLKGWKNFKRDDVRPGWQVKDGALVCADPHDAGDLCTTGQFDWFELKIDYNISRGGNSGIIYHVTDEGGATWATGPEFQLEDNKEAADPVRCGWLYALYEPPISEETGKKLDATRPAGQWNHIRLLITPEKCEHEINGVKYFEYVLGSDDFKARVSASKFGRMPLFAKSDIGYIALQGDHGQVSFRNIKIRPIKAQK